MPKPVNFGTSRCDTRRGGGCRRFCAFVSVAPCSDANASGLRFASAGYPNAKRPADNSSLKTISTANCKMAACQLQNVPSQKVPVARNAANEIAGSWCDVC